MARKKSGVQDLADTMIKQHGLDVAWQASLQQCHDLPAGSKRYFIWFQKKRRGY